VYWQVFRTRERIFYLFGAYYDVRQRPYVRVLGMTDTNIDKRVGKVRAYCQIWFADYEETCIVGIEEYLKVYQGWWGKRDGFQYPYLLTCPVPKEHRQRIAIFVSLVERECDIATNNFRVIFDKPTNAVEKKGRLAVCVRMMDFYRSDESARIVEWIELMGILGAEKIYFYNLHLHENITKVLEYYERKGRVEVTPFTFPETQIYEPASFQHLAVRQVALLPTYNLDEQVSLNDCFYKNMYKYEYITTLDTDEVIAPKKVYRWADLLSEASAKASKKNRTPAFYVAKNVLFNSACQNPPKRHEDIPPYMPILQNVIGHTAGIARNPKVFFDTDRVTAIHNHRAQRCFTGKCSKYEFDVDDALLYHYRKEEYADRVRPCDEIKRSMMTDTTIWKYKETLINRTLTVLYDLGFFSKDYQPSL
jgi:hypothetical protein